MFEQSLLPGFPEGAQRIGASLSILERDGQVIYFVGGDNYFSHPQDDLKSRRFVLASLMENGHVRAVDLQKPPLCLAHRTLMNWTAQYRKQGSVSFFRNAPVAKPVVVSTQVSAQCAGLLAEGPRPSVAARQVGINESTLRKAIKRQAIPVLPKPIFYTTVQKTFPESVGCKRHAGVVSRRRGGRRWMEVSRRGGVGSVAGRRHRR